MKAILGLGNPGLRYKFSRHNLGFLVVKKLAQANSIKLNQKSFNCLLGNGLIGTQKLLLGLPLTFMNLSGGAVSATIKRNKIGVTDLLIVLDDINLPLGKIRIRPRGSDGGHKGLRSIIETLGTQSFARLRIGVGRPKVCSSRTHLTEHVLSRFNKRESKIINDAAETATEAAQTWVKAGIQAAMNKYNK